MKAPLDEVVALAKAIDGIPDDRPAWLKELPSASDNMAPYYRFFHEYVKRYGGVVAYEIGTYVGTSAAHLAFANKGGTVVTVDHNTDAKRQVEMLKDRVFKLTNQNLGVFAVTADSMEFAKTLLSRTIDFLFIDGNHTFNQAYGEYEAYRPFVNEGGLVVFDDIHLPMATREMEVLFSMIPDAKADVSWLHHTGMGIAQVHHAVAVPKWKDAIAEATRRFAK